MKASIITHYRRYATGSVLAMLAGFISFPIMTRLLDNHEYGIFGYYDVWVLMAVAIGKLGAQHAIQRFYPHGSDGPLLTRFSTNLFYLPLAISFSIWAVVVVSLGIFDIVTGERQSAVFWMVMILSPISIFCSLSETVMRVTENSKMVMISRVGWRWLELLAMLSAVWFIARDATTAYAGKLLAAFVMLSLYVRWITRHLDFSRSAIHLPALREGLIYGLPLVLNEMIAVALVTVDRLMLKALSGEFSAVGIYSIGSALAMQVNVFTNLTVFEAFTPTANRLFVTEGPAAVRALKKRILLPMTYAAIGIATLIGCLGTDAIVALSGSGKASSGPVFSWLGIVYCLQPLLLVSGYGLLLEKRSTKVLMLMIAGLIINAALNFVWIPPFGVMGAVYSTVVSSMIIAVAHCLLVPKDLLVLPDPKGIAIALIGSALAVAAVTQTQLFGLPAGWPRLIGGAALIGVIYATVVFIADWRLRELLKTQVLTRLRKAKI